MQIIKPGAGASNAFVIQPGKQLTLAAQGLAADDYVQIEVVILSKAPDFNGNVCCDIGRADIEVVSFTPLLCAPGIARKLTAESPYVVIDGPQLVTLRATVHASPAASVSVDLFETNSDGTAELWRCGGSSSISISSLPIIEIKKHVVDAVEVCGEVWYIWSDGSKTVETVPACPAPIVYCPSLPLSCDGQAGYGYHIADPKDPAATVEMAPCADDTASDSIWIYPTAGAGHTIKVMDCDGVVIGYAANRSDCAAEQSGCTGSSSIKLVSQTIGSDGAITNTFSDGSVITSNPLPSC